MRPRRPRRTARGTGCRPPGVPHWGVTASGREMFTHDARCSSSHCSVPMRTHRRRRCGPLLDSRKQTRSSCLSTTLPTIASGRSFALRGILLEGDPCPPTSPGSASWSYSGRTTGSPDRGSRRLHHGWDGDLHPLHSHSYLALINSRVTWTSIGLPLPSVSSPVNRPPPPSVAYESVPPITLVSPRRTSQGR